MVTPGYFAPSVGAGGDCRCTPRRHGGCALCHGRHHRRRTHQSADTVTEAAGTRTTNVGGAVAASRGPHAVLCLARRYVTRHVGWCPSHVAMPCRLCFGWLLQRILQAVRAIMQLDGSTMGARGHRRWQCNFILDLFCTRTCDLHPLLRVVIVTPPSV